MHLAGCRGWVLFLPLPLACLLTLATPLIPVLPFLYLVSGESSIDLVFLKRLEG